MKKTILTLILSLASGTALAGGSGGGGVLSRVGGGLVTIGNGSGELKSEYVKYLGDDRGEIIFEYGQVNQRDELYSEKFKTRAEEIKSNRTLKALDISAANGDWVKLK